MITRREMMFSLLAGSLAGCGMAPETLDSAATIDGAKYLLSAEPTGAIGVAEAKEAIAQSDRIVLIGRIQGGVDEPWNAGRAAFFVSDAAAMIEMDEDDHHHEAGHDHENCPFCNRNKNSADSQAIVQFLGDDGKVLPVDARRLLPVEEGQLVVVQGRGRVDDLGTLIIAAEGIYVRR
ncbi:MAG: hypothetical protein KDA42_14415 [Planctomycetales bacterium]|nr:hypothetical protein [Planctomycetales bacterium]